MATEFFPSLIEVNGIDLTNYFPCKRTYDSVVYMHKRFLKKHENKDNFEKVIDKTPSEEKRCKCENSQQHCNTKTIAKSSEKEVVKMTFGNSLLEQTIKFAKNIAPLVIPPSEEKSPTPVYTVKTCKKSRKKSKNPPESISKRTVNVKHETDKPRKLVETFRKEKVKSRRESSRESVTHSSRSNTLDEININHSLSCTLSEISEKIYRRRERNNKNKNDTQKFVASESFDALATELINVSGDTKIKIQLMNETDKHLFREDIQGPVVKAIKEGLLELLNKTNGNTELVTVQKFLKCNSLKLDNILEKLTCIEQKIDYYFKDSVNTKSPKPKAVKASILEALEEDLFDVIEQHEVPQAYNTEKRKVSSSTVVTLTPIKEKKEKVTSGDNLCHGEEGLGTLKTSSSAQMGVKPDRPNRIPARFCWTDTARKIVE